MRVLAALLLGALLLVAATLAWRLATAGRGGPGASLPRAPASAEATDRAPDAVLPTATSSPSEPHQRVVAGAGVADVEHPPAAPRTTAAPTPLLRGRVVLEDAREPFGAARFNGELELLLGRGKGGWNRRVEVDQGQWSVTIPAGTTHVAIEALTAGEALLVVDAPRGQHELPREGELVVHARWPRPALLRVVDARDGRELNGLELVQDHVRDAHPGGRDPGRVYAAGLRSPIDLGASLPLRVRQYNQRFFVGAPGYAWSRVRADFESGGERILPLAASGDLELTLVGPDPGSQARLRLRTAGGVPLLSLDASPGTQRIERLPAGPLRASVGPPALGDVEVRIVAGELVRATLPLEAPPPLVTAGVAGRLLLPSAWGAEQPPRIMARLQDAPIGGFQPVQEAFTVRVPGEQHPDWEVYTWHLAALQVGRYEIATDRPRFPMMLDVPPAGLRDVVLEVPPPAELLVRVLDEATGGEAALEGLAWRARPEGTPGGTYETVPRDGESGLFRIVAPATTIVLIASDAAYQGLRENIDLAPGTTLHTLRLRRPELLTVALRDGDTRLPFPEHFHGLPRPGEGLEGQARYGMWGAFERSFKLSRAGPWIFEPPAVPGYAPAGPRRIDVRPGEPAMLVIELRRATR